MWRNRSIQPRVLLRPKDAMDIAGLVARQSQIRLLRPKDAMDMDLAARRSQIPLLRPTVMAALRGQKTRPGPVAR